MMILFLLFGIGIKDISATELVTHQSLNITKILDGLDGQIEIQRDRRISEKEILAIKDHDPESNPENSLIFKANPIRPGVVRLLSKNGKELSRLYLDKFFASIETEMINNNGKRIMLITQDFGIGMGSYNGPLTKILKVEKKKISWEKSYNFKSKKSESISLMRSLKTAWNFGPKNKLGEVDILKVSCRPDEKMKKSGFKTSYSRYHYSKNKWILKESSEDLLWEVEDGSKQLGVSLPDVKYFPIL